MAGVELERALVAGDGAVELAQRPGGVPEPVVVVGVGGLGGHGALERFEAELGPAGLEMADAERVPGAGVAGLGRKQPLQQLPRLVELGRVESLQGTGQQFVDFSVFSH